MPSSTNLALPYIDANQNQKHVTHNTALQILDALVQIQVQSATLTAPPGSPSDGQVWIVASRAEPARGSARTCSLPPTKAAPGHSIHRSLDTSPTTSRRRPRWYGPDRHGSRSWRRSRPLMLSALGIGTAADLTNPLSVTANNALFNAKSTGAGGTGDMRLKLNKAAVANTASFLFQDAFSGRAEIGLTGDDSFHFKVSPDGTTFRDALALDSATGLVNANFGFSINAPGNIAAINVTTNDTTTTSTAGFLAFADATRMSFLSHSSARTIVRYGLTIGGWSEVFCANNTGTSNGLIIGTQQNVPLVFGTQDVERMRIDGSGNIGIGSTSPGTKLDVNGLVRPGTYTVATLPAGVVGAMAFASNGRKGSEGAGAGTGVLVVYSNGAWRRLSDDTTVAA